MELTRKGKMLRNYGRSLADEFDYLKEINEASKGLDYTILVRGEIYKRINSKLDEVKNHFKSSESKKIINYFAERLFEMGELNFAYDIYKRIDSKNVKVMEKTFPKQMLEFVVISKDNRVFPINRI
jgi:hypothetical protein